MSLKPILQHRNMNSGQETKVGICHHETTKENTRTSTGIRNIPIKELWKRQAAHNKHPRLAWKKLLGETLTARITRLRDTGLTEKQVYNNITKEHPYLTIEAKHRLKISISARTSEQETLLKRLNSHKEPILYTGV